MNALRREEHAINGFLPLCKQIAPSLQIVLPQAIGGEFGVGRVGAAVVGVRVDADAAARGEQARHLDVLRVHEADEVFHDDVHAVFVEVAVVAETKQVEFQAFAFHHAAVGQVTDADFRKVGLPGDGAETGELGAVEAHPIIVVGVLVFKGFQNFRRIIAAIFRFLAEGVEGEVFAHIYFDLGNSG